MTETVEKKAPAKAEKNIEKESSSGKSAAGKGAGAGAKKASSGAEPAVKAGKAGTRRSRNNRKKGPQHNKGCCKGKNHPFLRGSKISREETIC